MNKEERIILLICNHLGVDYTKVISRSRVYDISYVRQIAMYFVRAYSSCSYPCIGRIFKRTHAPVIYACRRVKEICEVDKGYGSVIEEIDRLIQKELQVKMKKIYISGAITGRNIEDAKKEFATAVDMWRMEGCEPVNPFDSELPDSASWEAHMRADLKMLLDCDAIHMLPSWEKSRGAVIEKGLAESLGIEVILKAI